MRLDFSTSWIFRGWIICVLISLYAQHAVCKTLQCDETHYWKGSRCCKKCEPGFRVYSDCTDSSPTKCIKCNRDEYQPGWTDEKHCLQQKFCDPFKGFLERPENFVSEEPCRCLPHLQCYPINCEYCEKIPTCSAGYGLEVDHGSTNGRKVCVPCKSGFYSDGNNGEQCKQWTNCKAEGRSEKRPGTAQANAMCGPPVSAPSWLIVSVLSVITVLCLLILLLFCYKDKLKLLSVNLRSCVQNLKRTRIQQETLAPLYHSAGPKSTPCETTKLICQAPNNPTDETSCPTPTSAPDVKVSLPFTGEMTESEGAAATTATEDQGERSGEPEEVSEEEVVSVSPLLAGSCVCVIPIREPLEVGENEDCSQAVYPGTPGTCSCGGLDGEESGIEEKNESVKPDNGTEKADGAPEKIVLCKSETAASSLVSHSPPLLHTPSAAPPSSPPPELCLPLSQTLVSEFKPYLTDGSQENQEEIYRLASMDSTSTETSTTSGMASVSPLMTSSSDGDLYLDKSPEASSVEQSQELSWENGSGNKLSSGESELQCSPESLHSQLAEPTLTSELASIPRQLGYFQPDIDAIAAQQGQVSGSHNTTFISSGQVMNFSGDVIVVYVSQTSVGSEGAGQDDAFGSPVQEEANETLPFFQNSLRSQGDSISHITSQDETLPIQEMVEERPMRK